MKNWLKGMFGSSTPLPAGVSPAWAEELRKMLADAHLVKDAELTGANLDAAVTFVLHGAGEAWAHPPSAVNSQRWVTLRPEKRSLQPGFHTELASIPGDVLLRWALVLEGFMAQARQNRFHMAFPGNVHWPEIVLSYGAGGLRNVWPPEPTTQVIAYSTLEKILLAAGMEPQSLLTGAFATPVDTAYQAGAMLLAVSDCPDYGEAVGRHLESLRPLILAGPVDQRLHVLTLLSKVTPDVLDRLAPELAELAVSSSKQVRIAADGLVTATGPSIEGELKRFALQGKPEQRLHALRLLEQRAVRLEDGALRDFAREAAGADKAPSVQALIAEWETRVAAEAAPEARYEVDLPVIVWGGKLSAEFSKRLHDFWREANGLIRKDNQLAREQYEDYAKRQGAPKWKLRHTAELSSAWLLALETRLAGAAPPTGEKGSPLHHVAVPALQKLAGEMVLTPAQLLTILHFSGLLFGRANHLSFQALACFNRLYAATGRPTLLELAVMLRESGHDSELLVSEFCKNHPMAIARTWRREDVWPYFAQHLPALERLLLAYQNSDYFFDRRRVYDAIAMLPRPPARLVNALYAVALGQGKSERRQAQDALAAMPDKEARIVTALADGKSEVRAIAAQWLGRLRHAPAIAALEQAVAVEKFDHAKGAMLDALEILGQPVDKYLKRELLLTEARKSLARGIPKDLDWIHWTSLPVVRWADSGDMVASEVLQWMIAQACRAKSPEPGAVLRKYCAMFEAQGRERLGQWVLEQWLAEDVAAISPDDAERRAQAQAQAVHRSMASHPQFYQNNPLSGKTVAELVAHFLPSFLRYPKGSAIASKGVLAVAAACAGGDAAAPVARYTKEWYGQRAAQCKALIAMLAWIDHPNATQVMLAIGNRFRTKSIQEEAARQAEALAERKGWTLAELADRTIPTAGFDENGDMDLPYGTRIFSARLLPTFKIDLYNPDGKKIAALPEPRMDDDAELAKAAKKTVSAARKDLKSIIDLQTDRLYEALCTGRDWSLEDWSAFLNRHPVVRHLTQRLVWTARHGAEDLVVFRPLADGTLTDEADEAVELPADARIGLAHDTLLNSDVVQRWQQHLIDYEITPLFQQLGKGTFELPAGRAKDREIDDFKGYVLEAFALRGRAGKLGYQRSAAEDGGWFHRYEKRFPTLGVVASIQFTGNSLPEENRTVALLTLSFNPSHVDNAWEGGELPLGDIPKVLLSECYNDVRLMAGEGTGFDPDWEKKIAY